MGLITEDQDSEKALNISEGGGMKRTNHEELEGKIRENLRVKKVRVPEELDENFEALGKMHVDTGGQEEGSEHGVIVGRVNEDKVLIRNEVSCRGELDGSVDDVKEKNKLGFDLNVGALKTEDGVLELGLQDAHVIAERKVEVIDILSDTSSDEEEKVIDVNSRRRKDKQIEKGDSYESPNNLSLGLGAMEVEQAVGGSSLVNGGTRYTKEEKGKTEVGETVYPWLSLAAYPFPTLNLQPLRPELRGGALHQEASSLLQQAFSGSSLLNVKKRYTKEEKGKGKVGGSGYPWLSRATYPFQSISLQPLRPDFREIGQHREAISLLGTQLRLNLDAQPIRWAAWPTSGMMRNVNLVNMRNVNLVNHCNVLNHTASRLAGFKCELEDCTNRSCGQEQKFLSLRVDEQLGNIPGPFSTALKTIRELNLKQSAQQLIEWKPSNNGDCRNSVRFVPSLLDLSLRVLAENVEGVVSLEPIPHLLRRKLTDALCNIRKMNTRILDLLLKGSPPELHIKDCSWLAENQFIKSFKNLDGKNLMVLQLDLCGQCTFDYVLGETFGRSANSLPNLGIISLKGACRLSDDAVKALMRSAPALRSLNLGQCSLLTETGINFIADSLGPILRELYIDECQRIDAMLIVPALLKFKHLEVLSVAGIQTVCDPFVYNVVTVCGRNLKELNLADCLKLTNYSLKLIASTCVDLRALNISKLDKLTDVGIEYLANGCRSIQTLKLHGNRFSDEAIAAFLEASGQSMKELSLNHVSKVGHNTALSLAKSSRNLISLDLSWCRRITNEALGLIVDCCLSLRLVKLFGCSQITEVFLKGHSNSLVQIVGLSKTRILDNVNILEPEEVLLRYSPLPLPSDL